MNFLKKLFVRRPEEYLEKGDRLLESKSIYEARVAFEDGLHCCKEKHEYNDLAALLTERIVTANSGLAVLNIEEAEHAIARDSHDKAVEHLELAITLTEDRTVREKAEFLLSQLEEKTNDTGELAPAHHCSSCSSSSTPAQDIQSHADGELLPHEYYELLILQLPGQIQQTYADLGEDFASMYIAASHDSHLEALEMLERWFDGTHRDIYYYEKGKILHRLGKVIESEACLRNAIIENENNPLPHLGLALLFVEEGRYPEADEQLERMIRDDVFTGQAMMMRGEVFRFSGNSEAAINQFGALLDTPLGLAAAEKLHELLLESGRNTEAAHIFKKYLGNKCKH